MFDAIKFRSYLYITGCISASFIICFVYPAFAFYFALAVLATCHLVLPTETLHKIFLCVLMIFLDVSSTISILKMLLLCFFFAERENGLNVFNEF